MAAGCPGIASVCSASIAAARGSDVSASSSLNTFQRVPTLSSSSRSTRRSPIRPCCQMTTAAKMVNVASSAIEYHTVKRGRSDSRVTHAPSLNQLIPSAPAGANQALARSAQLAAKPLNVDVDDVRQRIVVFVPDVFRNVRSADHVARPAHEVLEQRVFLG